MKILNRTKDKYDWEKDEQEEIGGLVEDDVPKPDTLTEMPVINFNSEQMDPVPDIKDNEPTDTEQESVKVTTRYQSSADNRSRVVGYVLPRRIILGQLGKFPLGSQWDPFFSMICNHNVRVHAITN